MLATETKEGILASLKLWHAKQDYGQDQTPGRAAYAEYYARSLGWYLDVQIDEKDGTGRELDFIADLISETGTILDSEGELRFDRNEPRTDPFRRVIFADMAETALKALSLWDETEANGV